MEISDVRIRLVSQDGGKLKAVASLTIDKCFAVHDIKIVSGEGGDFVAMPSRKTPDGDYKDIVHPSSTVPCLGCRVTVKVSCCPSGSWAFSLPVLARFL